MINPIQIAFTYIIIVLSAVVHEYAHAFAAHALGDDTAQREGRLSLNPFVHMELFGTVIIPLLLLTTSGVFIGWAKPVPYNPFNLRDKRHGSLKVALAGPAANFIIAAILGIVIRLHALFGIADTSPLFGALAGILAINIFLGLFNLIPVPPLDGSKVLFDLFPRTERQMARIGFIGIFIALFLSFYILSPVAQFLFSALTGYQF
jgi:Zn-dependent protease